MEEDENRRLRNLGIGRELTESEQTPMLFTPKTRGLHMNSGYSSVSPTVQTDPFLGVKVLRGKLQAPSTPSWLKTKQKASASETSNTPLSATSWLDTPNELNNTPCKQKAQRNADKRYRQETRSRIESSPVPKMIERNEYGVTQNTDTAFHGRKRGADSTLEQVRSFDLATLPQTALIPSRSAQQDNSPLCHPQKRARFTTGGAENQAIARLYGHVETIDTTAIERTLFAKPLSHKTANNWDFWSPTSFEMGFREEPAKSPLAFSSPTTNIDEAHEWMEPVSPMTEHSFGAGQSEDCEMSDLPNESLTSQEVADVIIYTQSSWKEEIDKLLHIQDDRAKEENVLKEEQMMLLQQIAGAKHQCLFGH